MRPIARIKVRPHWRSHRSPVSSGPIARRSRFSGRSSPIRSVLSRPRPSTARMVISSALGARGPTSATRALIQTVVARGGRPTGEERGDETCAGGCARRWSPDGRRSLMAVATSDDGAGLPAHAPRRFVADDDLPPPRRRANRWLALPPGATLDVGHEMMLTTFAIIVETMLSGPDGMDARVVERGVSDYLAATPWMFVMALLKAPRWIPFPGSHRAALAIRVMRGTLRKRIAARRLEPSGGDDLLAMLLAAADPQSGGRGADRRRGDGQHSHLRCRRARDHRARARLDLRPCCRRIPGCLDRLVAEVDRVTGGRSSAARAYRRARLHASGDRRGHASLPRRPR